MVTWTHADPVYAGGHLLEASVDVNTSAWAEHLATLARVRTLGDNWDGEDSVPPSFSIWSRANIFLSVLRKRELTFPPTKIAVSPDGLIAFEWYADDVFLRAEVGDSNEVEWMFSIPGSPTEFKTETVPELTAPEQGQVWQPAEVDAPAYASER
jgi:hypothetical protein